MRKHLANAVSGVLDYAAYPMTMLFAAPLMIRSMGAAQYGIWLAAMAALNIGATLASGFCDANIQRVSTLRNNNQKTELVNTVRAAMGIHLFLGVLIALVCCMTAPILASRLNAQATGLTSQAAHCLRIVSFMIVMRALESVCISTLRAFERFARAVRISAALRMGGVVVATLLAYAGVRVDRVVDAMAIIALVSTVLQMVDTCRFLEIELLTPSSNLQDYRNIAVFGFYSWLLAAGTVMFTQTDRLLTGATLGAVSLASYGLCVQLAQPIYGALSSGLQFLFPHLSQLRVADPHSISRVVKRAILANGIASVTAIGSVLLFGLLFLTHWAASSTGVQAARMLPMIVAGSGLASCSATGYYVLLALGRIRYVACVSVIGGTLTLLLIRILIPSFGVAGVIAARFVYGTIMLLLYVPIFSHLAKRRRSMQRRDAHCMALEEA